VQGISRRRIALTAALVLALAGLGAGLLVGRGSSAELVKGQPAVLASGQFTSGEWSTNGRALLVRRADGSLRLQLRNFQTQKAPELWVLLEPLNGSGVRRQLDGLQRAWGNQDYDLPAELAKNPLQRVIIFCAKCNKVWGSARLHAATDRQTA
jgi:Electron transfer DM13